MKELPSVSLTLCGHPVRWRVKIWATAGDHDLEESKFGKYCANLGGK